MRKMIFIIPVVFMMFSLAHAQADGAGNKLKIMDFNKTGYIDSIDQGVIVINDSSYRLTRNTNYYKINRKDKIQRSFSRMFKQGTYVAFIIGETDSNGVREITHLCDFKKFNNER